LLHVTDAFVLVLASQPTTASQLLIYGFIAVTCNIMITTADVHWAELI